MRELKDERREREKGLRRKGLVLKRVDVSPQATSHRGSVRAVTTSSSRVRKCQNSMDGLFISDRFSLLCVDMRLCACVRVCTSRFICTARQEGRLEGDVCRVDGVSGLQLSLLLQDLVTSL